MAEEEKYIGPDYGIDVSRFTSSSSPYDKILNTPNSEASTTGRKKYEERQALLIAEAKEKDQKEQEELRKTGCDRESIRLKAIQAQREAREKALNARIEQERQRQASLKEEKAKQEAAERQRIAQIPRPIQPPPSPITPSPSSASSSGAGCILPILGIIAFIAVLPFLIQLLVIVVPVIIVGGIIFAVIAGLFSKN